MWLIISPAQRLHQNRLIEVILLDDCVRLGHSRANFPKLTLNAWPFGDINHLTGASPFAVG